MRIEQLQLKNFRCFTDRSFEFVEGFNVIVGENGAGKTSVLDALGFVLSSVVERLMRKDPWSLDPRDVRKVIYQRPGSVTAEEQWPVTVECRGLLDGEALTWGRSFVGLEAEEVFRGSLSDGRPYTMNDYRDWKVRLPVLELGDAVMRGEDRTLPAVAHYHASRLWQAPTIDRAATPEPASRLRGYEHWSSPDARVKRMLEWFKVREQVALRKPAEPSPLGVVREAIAGCVEGCVDACFDLDLVDLLLTFSDGLLVPFATLSDGLRGMCALVGDLAYRCAELNPHLGLDAARATPGVVLIDEIDLHLHPRWQRRVVDDLRRVFPKVQFFATTHSPFIIQSLRPRELVDLDGRVTGEVTKGSIEDISEGMGVEVPQRSERFLRMVEAAEKYYRALDAVPEATPEERGRLKQELDALSAPFSDDPAFVAFLNVERAARGLERLPLPPGDAP